MSGTSACRKQSQTLDGRGRSVPRVGGNQEEWDSARTHTFAKGADVWGTRLSAENGLTLSRPLGRSVARSETSWSYVEKVQQIGVLRCREKEKQALYFLDASPS